MEDNRTALAVLLCVIVIIAYTQIVLDPGARRPAVRPASDAVGAAPVASASPAATAPDGPAGASPAASVPSPEEISAAPLTVIDNGVFRLGVTHLGGRLVRAELLSYPSEPGAGSRPLDLVRSRPGSPLPLGLTAGETGDGRVLYSAAGSSGFVERDGVMSVPEGTPEARLDLDGSLPDGRRVRKTLVVSPNSYLLRVETSLEPAGPAPVSLAWHAALTHEDVTRKLDPEQLTIFSPERKLTEQPLSVPEASGDRGLQRWAAVGDRYFMAAVAPTEGPGRIVTAFDGSGFRLEASAPAPQKSSSFTVYAGPRDYDVLASAPFEMVRAVNLGFFSFLAAPLLHLLKFFFRVLGNYGLAIVLLTLVIKVLFLPLTKASFESMAAMQAIQPEMAELRERVKDPQQLNQEMMALYKRRGVNPLGGCLPMLVQIPVFFGLYSALLNSIELRHAPFALWIKDLSRPERLEVFGLPIPVMILLMGASMLVQQWTQPSTMDPQQRKIMMLSPVIFTVMFIVVPMPAGLVLYWLVNNMISIAQQFYLRRHREGAAHPLAATVVTAVGIFGFAFVLTRV